jgi:hypothetical protein
MHLISQKRREWLMQSALPSLVHDVHYVMEPETRLIVVACRQSTALIADMHLHQVIISREDDLISVEPCACMSVLARQSRKAYMATRSENVLSMDGVRAQSEEKDQIM